MKKTNVPVFPLKSVALPGSIQSLQIFEPRYINMIKESLKLNRGFVIAFFDEGNVKNNILISKNLGLPVILVAQGENKELKEITDSIQLAYDTFREDVDVLSIMINKVNADDIISLKDILRKRIQDVK